MKIRILNNQIALQVKIFSLLFASYEEYCEFLFTSTKFQVKKIQSVLFRFRTTAEYRGWLGLKKKRKIVRKSSTASKGKFENERIYFLI